MIQFPIVPQRFSPCNNPIIFNMSGSSPNLLLFKYSIIEATSQAIIFNGDAVPTPLNPQSASINLTKQLSALVRSDIDNQSLLIGTGKTRNIIQYQIQATEYGLSGNSLIALASAYTPTNTYSGITYNTFYAFEADLSIPNYSSFNDANYLAHSGITQTSATTLPSFLTYVPDYKTVNYDSFEQLYFLQDINFSGVTYPYAYTAFTGGFSNSLRVRVNYPPFNSGGSVALIITNDFTGNTANPAMFSTALLTITGTSAMGDNISVTATTSGTPRTLGSYTALTSADTTSQIATKLAGALSGNSFGFNIGVTGNTIGIYSSGNTIGLTGGTITNYPNLALSTSIKLTGTTGYTATTTVSAVTSTTAVQASAVIGGFATPSSGDITSVQVNDPTLGTITLASYSVTSPDAGSMIIYLSHLVGTINLNTHGYVANVIPSTSFSVTAPSGTSYNGHSVTYNQPGVTVTGSLSGAVNSTSGISISSTTITIPAGTYSPIKASISQFTGGTNAITLLSVFSGSPLSKMYAIQTSPSALVKFIPDMQYLTDGSQYNVTILDSHNSAITQTRNYIFREPDCTTCFINVLWSNSLGGIDSYQMLAPQETITATKLSIKKNNVDLTSSNPFLNGDVYNPTDSVYSSAVSSQIKCYTNILTDAQATWLIELVKSKEIWFVSNLGNLVPLTLVTTNYSVQKQRYMGNVPNQFQFTFQLPDNFYE